MLELTSMAAGVLLRVRARPQGKKNDITGVHDGRLKVTVTAAPENGNANAALSLVLAKRLGLRKSQIELLRGATSQMKEFLLRDIHEDELCKRLTAAGIES